MANDKSKVSVGKPSLSGAVYRAPKGTTLPTDAVTALNEAFQGVGYISEEGVEWGYEVEQEFKAWGGDTVYQEMRDTAAFTMIESLNQEAAKVYYGDDAVGTLTGGYMISVGDPDLTACVWVFEMILRGGGLRRIVIPSGTVTERGSVTYADDNLVAYNVTVSAEQDSAGKTHYEYVKLPTGATGATGATGNT